MLRWTAKWIARTWARKLEDNMHFWAQRFPAYSEAIRQVANEHIRAATSDADPTHFAPGTMAVAAFIDCNVTATTRPGAGPATPGPGAARRDPGGNVQRAVYTGWLHLNGIKHECVMGPDGMALFIWGPASVRRNDLYALDKSNILLKWAAAMVTRVNFPAYRNLRVFSRDHHHLCLGSWCCGLRHVRRLDLPIEASSALEARECLRADETPGRRNVLLPGFHRERLRTRRRPLSVPFMAKEYQAHVRASSG